MTDRKHTAAFLFCGSGGGALGFKQARAEFRGVGHRYEILGGIDYDEDACDNFENLVSAPAFWADMNTITLDEVRKSTGGVPPDVVFTSPPCVGFSGLLSNAMSETPKYQAFNNLVYMGLFKLFEAWPGNKPKLILLENVPRIVTRGAAFLDRLIRMLQAYGYVIETSSHDCGVLGGLAQHRNRFLLIARDPKQLPRFVYKPPIRRVKAIGEILDRLPLPEDRRVGKIHNLPRLQWKTWVRLALIRAGKDWRDLGIKDGKKFNNQFRIVPWSKPSVAVTGGGTPTSGGVNVADPRHQGRYQVVKWDREHLDGIPDRDPRLNRPSRPNLLGVCDWEEPIGAVIGEASVTGSNGTAACADPRFGVKMRGGTFGIIPYDEPSGAVIGSADIHASKVAVATPRWPEEHDVVSPAPVIISMDDTWHRPLTTFELAALQGFPVRTEEGYLQLVGDSHSNWRKHIGNAVPPPTARAIAEVVLEALALGENDVTYTLFSRDVWVQPVLYDKSLAG